MTLKKKKKSNSKTYWVASFPMSMAFSLKGEQMMSKFSESNFLAQLVYFAQIIHRLSLKRTNSQNFELIQFNNKFQRCYFYKVYLRFRRNGKMASFTSQTWPLRRETSQRRQPEVILAVISLPLAVVGVNRSRILRSLLLR